MAEFTFEIEHQLTPEQVKFVEDSMRSALNLLEFSHDRTKIRIRYADSETESNIRAITKKFVFIAKNIDKDLVFANPIDVEYTDDPQPALEAAREVIPVHPGFFTLQGDFLRVFKALNTKVKSFADELGAIEQEYPAVWPVRLFKTIDYFHEFPQQVILCAPVKDDFESRKEFSSRYAKSQAFETVETDHLIADSEYGLEPAVCDCCYYGLEGMKNLENAYYTCYNKVFRNERSGSNRLDRLTNFSVRDIMFVGSEPFVLECRQTLIEILSDFIKDLCLHAKIETANDPFFANESAMKSVFQNAHRLKYELLAKIPHLDRDIAVGSINFHTDFFGKAFGIETTEKAPANSGCIGVGMERMTYALYCQHGPNLSAWPNALTDYLMI